MNEININVVICDRNYTITLKREEEENIRKAVADISKKMKGFSDKYAYKDTQDLLAMTALQISSDNINNINKINQQEEQIKSKIVHISKLVDDCIGK